jgi:hypothetical protein
MPSVVLPSGRTRSQLYIAAVATRSDMGRRQSGGCEEGCGMAGSITEIYGSSNGDRWQLVRIPDPRTMLVRHIPLISRLVDRRQI